MLLHHYLAMAVLAVLATAQKEDCIKLVTYNAVMMPNYRNHTMRRIQVPKDLNVVDADVYCLQEYWDECDIEPLVEELQNKYPHHYSQLHEEVGHLNGKQGIPSTPCVQTQVDYFEETVMSCADHHGCRHLFHKNPIYGPFCLAEYCANELRAPNVSATCYSCIIRYAFDSFREGINRCLGIPDTCNKQHNPSGLVLISKRPLKNVKYTSLHGGSAMTYPRGYLSADVEDFGKVVCTQLTEVIPLYLEYDYDLMNYDSQQLREIFKLIADLKHEEHILMGDFNVGPAISEHNVSALSSGVYDRFTTNEYSDPYVTQDGRCTSCTKDGFNVNDDHIFIKGEFGNMTRRAKRVLDSPSVYEEDKFGVQLQMCGN